MASINYKPTQVVLSSTLPDIKLTVELPSIRVTMHCGQDCLLDEVYFSYGDGAVIYESAQLIEEYMRHHGLSLAKFTVRLHNGNSVVDSHTYSMIYCDRMTVCSDQRLFLSENFLTTLNYRRIAPGQVAILHYLAFERESTVCLVYYRYRVMGEVKVDSFAMNMATHSRTELCHVVVPQDYIIRRAAQRETAPVELVSFNIRVGQRSVTFVIDPQLKSSQTFIFRNCFNVTEYADIAAQTTAKTEIERSMAVVSGSSLFYDAEITKEHKVVTGGLTSDEAQWIDQLLTSHEVQRMIPNDFDETEPLIAVPVLITESTCEITDGDDEPNSVSFTWRVAQNRAPVHLTCSQGIFNDSFNNSFD